MVCFKSCFIKIENTNLSLIWVFSFAKCRSTEFGIGVNKTVSVTYCNVLMFLCSLWQSCCLQCTRGHTDDTRWYLLLLFQSTFPFKRLEIKTLCICTQGFLFIGFVVAECSENYCHKSQKCSSLGLSVLSVLI